MWILRRSLAWLLGGLCLMPLAVAEQPGRSSVCPSEQVVEEQLKQAKNLKEGPDKNRALQASIALGGELRACRSLLRAADTYREVFLLARSSLPADKVEELALRAIDFYREESQVQQQGQTILDLSIWLYRRLESDRARIYLDQLAEHTAQHQLEELEANRLLNYGNTYHVQKRIDEAIGYYVQTIAYAEPRKFKHPLIKAMINLSGMHIHQLRFTEAIRVLNKVMEATKELQLQEYQSHALANLAYIYSLTDQPQKAIAVNNEALEMDFAKGRNITRVTILLNNGLELLKMKDIELAKSQVQEAIDIAKDLQLITSYRVGLNHLGQIYREINQLAKAEEYFLKAYEMKEGQETTEILRAALELLNILLTRGNVKAATPYFEEAKIRIKTANDRDFDRRFHESAIRYYDAVGEPLKTIDHYKALSSLKDELFKISSQKELVELDSRYQNEAKQKKIELLEKEKAYSDLQLEKGREQRRLVSYLMGTLILLLLVLYSRFHVKNKAARLIEEKQRALEKAYSDKTRAFDELSQAERTISEQYREIADLLNNMRHGLFLVDGSGVICGPVSAYCRTLFGGNVEGLSVFDVLYSDYKRSDEVYGDIVSVFTLCFQSDEFQWSLAKDGLPEHVRFTEAGDTSGNARYLRCSYNPLFDEKGLLDKLMLVIEDETDLIEARHRLDQARHQNERNFEILHAYIICGFRSARDFFENSSDLLQKFYVGLGESFYSADQEVFFMRILHTIKGNARQKSFNIISKSIHEVEQFVLDGLKQNKETKDKKAILHNAYERLFSILYEHAHLGQMYFDLPNDVYRHGLQIVRTKLDQIVHQKQGDELIDVSLAEVYGDLVRIEENAYAQSLASVLDCRILDPRILAILVKLQADLEADPEVKVRTFGSHDPSVVEVYRENIDYTRSILQHKRLTPQMMNELRYAVDSLDHAPIGRIFLEFRPMVHEIGERLGKKVELVTQSVHAMVDKETQWLLSESLVHLIRNSIDHGLEPPDERIRQGKAEIGLISLSCTQWDQQLTIEVRDDGRGLNIEKIYARAKAQGLVDETTPLSPSEISMFIFEANFSTRDQVTELSGRGVGMNIVKANIEKLGGRMTISHADREGTVFQIELPRPGLIQSSKDWEIAS